MLSKDFTARLQAVQKAGDLSGMDLATWFDRSQRTVWEWAKGRYAPRSPGRERAEQRLVLLEHAVAAGAFPAQINQRNRRRFIRSKLYDQLAKGNSLPTDHTA